MVGLNPDYNPSGQVPGPGIRGCLGLELDHAHIARRLAESQLIREPPEATLSVSIYDNGCRNLLQRLLDIVRDGLTLGVPRSAVREAFGNSVCHTAVGMREPVA